MPRIPLLSGSYVSRSIIANAQRCVNYFPEKNAADSPVPLTFYQRPGLNFLVQGPVAPVRGLYRASDGAGYCVIGQGVFYILTDWSLQHLGDLETPGLGQVSFCDNGTDILLVDSSTFGYTINLETKAFAKIVDDTGTFRGANVTVFLDTFILWNDPGTRIFGSTLSNVVEFDPLYIASKAGYPDPLVSIIVNRRQFILLGAVKSEIWYNAGNAQFPFAELPGTYIEHGCLAKFSVASQDIEAYWLGRDLQGDGVVFCQRGYETKRVSNHALEFALQEMRASGADISDAIGYCYQQEGHVFYVLTFPSGDQTWVYDSSIGDPLVAWTQRAWTDAQGELHRDRGNCFASLYGKLVVGDWQKGCLYFLDKNLYVDEVPNEQAIGISCIKGFPHFQAGWMATSQQQALADGKTVLFRYFMPDLECGTATTGQIWLRWSLDRGKTFGQGVFQSPGELGAFLTSPKWGQIGAGRDVIFEIGHNLNGPAALQGGWLESDILGK